MLDSALALKPYRDDDFLSSENLERADSAVAEIFKVMFGFDIKATVMEGSSLAAIANHDEMTAIVGFSGAMRGCCRIQINVLAARAIASAMLGGDLLEENDNSINDAVGELCNMLAGGWKNEVPALSSQCSLSPPTVISGRDYKVHRSSKPSLNVSRTYQFDGHILYLTLCREETASTSS